MPRPRRTRAAIAALAALTIAGIAGCSSSGSSADGAATSAGAAASEPAVATPPAPTQSAPSVTTTENAVNVDAIDGGSAMSFEVSGSPHAGLSTITFTNKGNVAHEMSLSRLKDGATLEQVKTLLSSPAPDAEQKAQALLIDPEADLGGPAILGPGLSEKVVMPLVAGHYVVVCFLPAKGGMPHAAMGMVGEFTVDAAGDAAQAPQADGTVTLSDKSIELPDGFSAGGTFEITNTGTKPHDVSIAALAGKPLMAYFQCVAGSFGKGTPIDECPGTLSGGVGAVPPGKSVYLTIPALKTGNYGYVSTQGDGTDFQAGLNGTFTVK